MIFSNFSILASLLITTVQAYKPQQIELFYRFPSFNTTFQPLIDDFLTGDLSVGQHYRLELIVSESSRLKAYFRRRFQFQLDLKVGEARKTLVLLKEAPWYRGRSKKYKKRSYGDEITSSVERISRNKAKLFFSTLGLNKKKLGRFTKVVMVFSLVSSAPKARLILRFGQTYPLVFPSECFSVQEGKLL